MPSKSKEKSMRACGMPKAPWIYVSDDTFNQTVVKGLLELIPEATYCRVDQFYGSKATTKHPLLIVERSNTILIADKLESIKRIRTEAITQGCNFASVNVIAAGTSLPKNDQWGTNHIDAAADLDAAVKVYKWLFDVLSVRETLHLIPQDQMMAIDKKNYPDYDYCPVSESSRRPKDAKIQFVALILEKPKVSEGKKLTWTVADRSGIANFYFQFRDDQSQYTWDWVLNLKPGDRRALPRMPRVEIKEKKGTRILKAPFRATGAVLSGTGLAIRAVGTGISKMGSKIKMGSSSEWVPEADIDSEGKKIDRSKPQAEKKRIDVFNEKGERNWSDGASIASTDIGSDFDEKAGKDFV